MYIAPIATPRVSCSSRIGGNGTGRLGGWSSFVGITSSASKIPVTPSICFLYNTPSESLNLSARTSFLPNHIVFVLLVSVLTPLLFNSSPDSLLILYVLNPGPGANMPIFALLSKSFNSIFLK